jgi:hypothetical integral membrane protein (TIGR02206 family)
MSEWITFGPEDKPLEVFSKPHLAAVSVIVLACVAFALLCRRMRTERSKRILGFVLAAFIAFQQATIYIWYVYSGEWSAAVTLPLQLCDLSIFLSILLMLVKNRYLSELLYFWGLGGATQAILTPDIGNFTFPHYVFYQFFISHALILMAVIYLLAAENFRPSFHSVIRVFVITNIYGAAIFPVNLITGGNYLFLRGKPVGGSILDFLGPWPWYILSLEGVAAALFIMLYLPFAASGSKPSHTSLSS